MLGVNHAYVTAIGRLIGVVGLKELRWGIENANSGHLAKTAAAMAALTALHTSASMNPGKTKSFSHYPAEGEECYFNPKTQVGPMCHL